MLFPTVNFGIFFLIVFCGNWFLNQYNTQKKIFLLAVSYFFYATWDPQFLVLLLSCSFANYAIGLLIEKFKVKDRSAFRWDKIFLWIGIILNFTTLGLFKYYNFFLASLSNLLGSVHLSISPPILELALPLGISFFTFQGVSYIVDVYKGELTARKSPLDVLLFISFFPHLVAGPIVRASEFIPQLEKPPSSDIDGNRAILLIASGLFKKLVIANYLAIDLVDPVFESVGKFGGLNSWLAIYGYAMQIYCDFSAYSDMAIGFAALLGYRFPENFNQPYRAHSLQDFWRRWHISLSSWLRDYLYVPLGGSKNGKYKRYRNLFLTMFIGGIWHGASWTFVFWGSLHGGFLALERWYDEKNGESCACAPSRFWQRFVVFNFVCFAWIFFRCESLSKAFDFILSLFDFSQKLKVVTPFNVLLVVIGGLLHFLPTSGYDALTVRMARFPTPILGVLCGLLLMILASLTPDEVAPFIYFRF